MKVLIDARLYGLEHAGLGRYVLNLTEELKNLKTKEQFIILLRKKYFNKLRFPDNWKKVLADFRHYSLIEQILLPGIIKRENPNIVHFPHFNVPVFCKDRFIVTIHDLLMHKSKGKETTTLPSYQYFIKRLGYKIAFESAVKRSLKIIVPSNSIKREVLGYYKVSEEKVVVTYEGLDEAVFKNIRNERVLTKYNLEDKYFIYVGNAYPHKNLERAIEAVLSLNKKSKEKVLFAIAFSRSVFTERLEKVVKSLQAGRYVKLLGFVPDDELAALYKNSMAFVYPSLSEGFGLQGLESIAAGTLALASDIPVFKEVYKDNVLYFNPFDFTSIEKSMKEAIEMSVKDREKFIKKGQKFIQRYSWTKMAKQTLKVYKEAIRS